MALSSKMVRPLTGKGKNEGQKKKKSKKGDWEECYQRNRTITIAKGEIVHLFTTNVIPDEKYRDEKKLGYMEDYFLDEQSQLEKRIAIGDSSFLKDMKPENRKIMKEVIKDIQNQLLTHNGFVKDFRKYRDYVQKKIDDRLTQVEKEFDKHQRQMEILDSDDEELEDKYDDSNPLNPLKVDKNQRITFRKLMEEKKKVLDAARQEVRQELVHDRQLAIQMPYKNPTTIEQRTFNDPRSGVACMFIPKDQPETQRAAFYQCGRTEDDHKLGKIDERRAEYDLMAYPLFFPEGSQIQFGWTDNVLKVLEEEELITSHYNLIAKNLSKDEKKEVKTLEDKVNVIKKSLGLDNLTRDDFDYVQRIDVTKRTVTMRQWYNFLLQDRAGFLKPNVFPPKLELYEYNRSCNCKLSKNSEWRAEVKEDSEVYPHKVEINGREVEIFVHPKSRVPYTIENGIKTPIPLNEDGDPNALRQPENKNPILYGGRLKLFYFCDQGLKIDNNDLRIYESPKLQKSIRRVKFREAERLRHANQEVEKEGQPLKLTATKKKSWRWYDQKYQDAVALALEYDNADLFITVTGRENIAEIRRIRDKRNLADLVEYTNRFFQVKLKSILHVLLILTSESILFNLYLRIFVTTTYLEESLEKCG